MWIQEKNVFPSDFNQSSFRFRFRFFRIEFISFMYLALFKMFSHNHSTMLEKQIYV